MNKMLLLMGLPGSGKTTFAEKIVEEFKKREVPVTWFNADEVRKKFDDWDFSEEGRMRQANRMRQLVDESETEYNIVDMVAPLPEMRTTLNADHVVWMNTIKEGRFEDTNKAFVKPDYTEIMMSLPAWGTPRDALSIVNMVTGDIK